MAVISGGSDNNLYKDHKENYIGILYRAYMTLVVFIWWHCSRLFFLVSQVLISTDVF